MKRLLMGLAVLPFFAGLAVAAQPLTDQQMDRVTAGFSSISVADAEGIVGKGGIILTSTATLSQVSLFATGSVGEITVNVFKSLGAAQSSSVSSSIPTLTLGLQ